MTWLGNCQYFSGCLLLCLRVQGTIHIFTLQPYLQAGGFLQESLWRGRLAHLGDLRDHLPHWWLGLTAGKLAVSLSLEALEPGKTSLIRACSCFGPA